MIILNNQKVIIKKFPNGETLINTNNLKVMDNDMNEIKFKFENDEDIMQLYFLKNHLDELKVKCRLIIGYLPYSRMDRTENLTIFTLKYLCRLINNMNFEEVCIYEPHSDVSAALLDRVKVIDMSALLAEKILDKFKDSEECIYVVYPDAGAAKRYSKQIKYDKVLTANKERDFKTGYIKNLEINGSVQEDKFKAIIVDDLCSKGGTFMLTGSRLRDMGASEIYLVVTHCEDTIFKGDILKTDLIKKVYTTDSILSREHEKINITKIMN